MVGRELAHHVPGELHLGVMVHGCWMHVCVPEDVQVPLAGGREVLDVSGPLQLEVQGPGDESGPVVAGRMVGVSGNVGSGEKKLE